MSVALLLGTLLLLIIMGVPIAYALGGATVVYTIVMGIEPSVLVQRAVGSVDSFPLLAIPLFILAGELMNAGGITRRLVEFVQGWIGFLRGGLAISNVGGSLVFSGMSGSAVADTGGLGSVFIPAMREQGYTPAFAGAVTAASATVGPIIPPSIPLVIYGLLANVSIGGLFLAGVVPGLVLVAFMMVFTVALSARRNYPRADAFQFGLAIRSTVGAFWALLMPLVVVGGILAGVFTATEAAGAAVAYALVVGTVIYREVSLAKLVSALAISARRTAQVSIIVAFAGYFAWIISIERIPPMVNTWLSGLGLGPVGLALLLVLLLLVIGTFMEPLSAMLIFVPVLAPVAQTAGLDPLHFGIVVVLTLMIGLVTPPVGVCLYMVADIGEVEVHEVIRDILPFILVLVATVVVLVLVPPLATWLPSVAG